MQIGKIEQLTVSNGIEQIMNMPKPINSKILTINTLKKLREDYILTENDGAIDKVIDWLINCSPDCSE